MGEFTVYLFFELILIVMFSSFQIFGPMTPQKAELWAFNGTIRISVPRSIDLYQKIVNPWSSMHFCYLISRNSSNSIYCFLSDPITIFHQIIALYFFFIFNSFFFLYKKLYKKIQYSGLNNYPVLCLDAKIVDLRVNLSLSYYIISNEILNTCITDQKPDKI